MQLRQCHTCQKLTCIVLITCNSRPSRLGTRIFWSLPVGADEAVAHQARGVTRANYNTARGASSAAANSLAVMYSCLEGYGDTTIIGGVRHSTISTIEVSSSLQSYILSSVFALLCLAQQIFSTHGKLTFLFL